MKLLLDENVPAPITSTVKTLLGRSHDIQHVIDLPGWSGTCAALPSVLRELADADGQRLVTLKSIDPGRDHRYGVRDPAIDPRKFWPRLAA